MKVREGNRIFDVFTGILGGTLGAILGYIIAGGLTKFTDLSSIAETVISAVVLAISVILSYNIFKKTRSSIKNTIKVTRKRIKRNTILRYMSLNRVFLERQGINRRLSLLKDCLRYALTVPFGGALGYFSGIVGVTPLCVYLGEKAFESVTQSQVMIPSIESGSFSGIIIGIYAFTKMTAKKQYERLFTTASVLAGIAVTHIYFAKNVSRIGMFASKNNDVGLWEYLGYCVAGGVIAGIIGNLACRVLKKSSFTFHKGDEK